MADLPRLSDLQGDGRAVPALRVMRAALTMRMDRTDEELRHLDWAELVSLQRAAELLMEATASEIMRRPPR
jgi:hypothetical protein